MWSSGLWRWARGRLCCHDVTMQGFESRWGKTKNLHKHLSCGVLWTNKTSSVLFDNIVLQRKIMIPSTTVNVCVCLSSILWEQIVSIELNRHRFMMFDEFPYYHFYVKALAVWISYQTMEWVFTDFDVNLLFSQ